MENDKGIAGGTPMKVPQTPNPGGPEPEK